MSVSHTSFLRLTAASAQGCCTSGDWVVYFFTSTQVAQEKPTTETCVYPNPTIDQPPSEGLAGFPV